MVSVLCTSEAESIVRKTKTLLKLFFVNGLRKWIGRHE